MCRPSWTRSSDADSDHTGCNAGQARHELASRVGLSETQMSLFRSGKVRGIRFRTLAKLCAALHCVPGDLLGYDVDTDDFDAADEDP